MILDAPATVLFTLFYGLFAIGFIFQSREFSSAGLSPDNILSPWMQRAGIAEDSHFVQYHLRRSAGAMAIHSLMPVGYLLGYSYTTCYLDANYQSMEQFWQNWPIMRILLGLTLLLPILAFSLMALWSRDSWANHPFVEQLRLFNQTNWCDVVETVNTEFRRVDKFIIRNNPIVKVVVTDNWIVYIGQWPWSLCLAHQSDVTLNLMHSDHHDIVAADGQAGGTQFLSINVLNGRPRARSFSFRLNSLEYQYLQERVKGPIRNFRNITIYKTISERFVEVFSQQVRANPVLALTPDQELEACIGCMVETAEVKLVRRCDPGPGGQSNACVNCYCRPMWCLSCLGKWFASRQNQKEPETWLSSKCPCPTCRNKFCILDVSMVETSRCSGTSDEPAEQPS